MIIGSGTLPGKILLVRIVETNKINDYLGQVRLSKLALPCRVRKGI